MAGPGAGRLHVVAACDIGLVVDGAFDSFDVSDSSAEHGAAWLSAALRDMAPRNHAYQSAMDHGWDAASHPQAMDLEGIDVAVLFPSRGLFVLGFEIGSGPGHIRPDHAAAIAKAYNDWLYDFMGRYRHRLLGAAMIAPHDVDAAVAETRRCVERLGFRTIFLLPGLVGGREWHHPDDDPLWRACEELDVPVSFHGGGPDSLTDFGLGHEQYLMMHHTFSHCLGPMSTMVSFCAGGVLDRFPILRRRVPRGKLLVGAVATQPA